MCGTMGACGICKWLTFICVYSKDVKSQLQMLRFVSFLHETKVKISLSYLSSIEYVPDATVASHSNDEKLLLVKELLSPC